MAGMIIEMDEGGQISVDYQGFVGQGCDFAEQQLLDLLKDLEMQKVSEKRKDEQMGEELHV